MQTHPLTYENFLVRSFTIDTHFFFALDDICNVLKISDSNDAISKHLTPDLVIKHTYLSKDKEYEVVCISDMGVIVLTSKIKKAAANKFRHWITQEALPQLRDTLMSEVRHQETRGLTFLKEFEGTFLRLLKNNVTAEYRLELAESELEKYRRLERELSLHQTNLHKITREWLSNV